LSEGSSEGTNFGSKGDERMKGMAKVAREVKNKGVSDWTESEGRGKGRTQGRIRVADRGTKKRLERG
jgi:hypothetical protein